MNNTNDEIKKLLNEHLEPFNCAKEGFLRYYSHISKIEREAHPEFTEDEARISMAAVFASGMEQYFEISHKSAMKIVKDIVYPLICATRELESMGAIDVDWYLKKWEAKDEEA